MGTALQNKLADEVRKIHRPAKLKKMTKGDIKKMKKQFSILFEEPIIK